MSKSVRLVATPLVLLMLAIGLAAPASATHPDEQSTSRGFRKAVTTAGIREHLLAFQSHSDLNGGNRVGGSPGYEASADYVTERLQAAGYTVTNHYFDFLFNADRTPPVLRQVSPNEVTYVDGVDFSSMTFSESLAETTAPVIAVDLNVPAVSGAPDSSNTSGCEASDFSGFPAGAFALMQRGTCNFVVKSANAKAAGAAGAIIFNEGNSSGRSGIINGTLGTPSNGPAVGTTYALGFDLSNGVTNGDTGSVVTLKIDRIEETRTTRNIIAETAGGDPNNVVVVGAHLDSVPRGAGINDNGSGSAGILEVAEVLAAQQREVRNKVRFAWWGAEEFGLLGSRAYVSSLPQAARDRIALNLNFDMIASPNFVRFIYDGDNSAFAASPPAVADGPDGSGEIERVFRDYFASQDLPSAETPFNGRSDYGPFIEVGIPAGGLFTGAEGTKTADQALLFGGAAGLAYDPCYHLNCDSISNINNQALGQMSDAVAHAVLRFSQRNFTRNPLVDPAPVPSSGGNGGGGGLHEDHDHEVEAS
jgi:Zn-dependent M28 family amino/carboxypeptidase